MGWGEREGKGRGGGGEEVEDEAEEEDEEEDEDEEDGTHHRVTIYSLFYLHARGTSQVWGLSLYASPAEWANPKTCNTCTCC